MLATAPPPDKDAPAPKVLIVPHAALKFSGTLAAHAFARLLPLRGQIRRVVIIGTSHREQIRGLAIPPQSAFASPFGPVAIDRRLLLRLTRLPFVSMNANAHAKEHGIEIQLPFLQTVLGPGFSLVPILAGATLPKEIALALMHLWGGQDTLVIVSTDLSHNNDADTAQRLDMETARAIVDMAPERLEEKCACGRLILAGLLMLARTRETQMEVIGMTNSADTGGDPSKVVGYGAFAMIDNTRDISIAGDTGRSFKRTPAPGKPRGI